jgi:hypothetical protein
MPRGKLVAVNHVGGEQQEVVVREQVLSETHTIRFVFHDFANLPHTRDELTISSVVLCHGYQWKLLLYPGGDYLSDEDEFYLSLFLHCVSQSDHCNIKTKFAFRLPSANFSHDMGEAVFCRTSKRFGYGDFRLRSCVLDPSKGFLVDGNLTIEVDIQVCKYESPFWESRSELNVDFLQS